MEKPNANAALAGNTTDVKNIAQFLARGNGQHVYDYGRNACGYCGSKVAAGQPHFDNCVVSAAKRLCEENGWEMLDLTLVGIRPSPGFHARPRSRERRF